jgi:polysaccharide biosynthesis transport protein
MFDETEDQQSYSPKEIWAIAYRRRWWILLPLFFLWGAVWGISWLLPTIYQSEALILVEQQKVPEQYVVSNVTVDLQERLQSITQQILSRTRLQSAIERLHLYPARHGWSRFLQLGDPVEQMRKDIKIELVQASGHPAELTAFKIYYSASSPELAQQVNSELTSHFINESLKSQQQLSENTTAFLANQLAEARAKLEEQEANVRAFKAKHLGDLPSQLQSNVEILSGLQAQLQNAQRSLDGAQQQKLYLESQLQQYQVAQATLYGEDSGSSVDSLEKQLFNLRNQLADARSKYTEDHPDIVRIKNKFAETEKMINDVQHEMASAEKQNNSKLTAKVDEPGASLFTSALMEVRSQLKANALEVQNYQRQEKDIQSQIAACEARLNLTPATEQELADISRGYEESKSNYNSLLQKQNQSQLATSLEQRQQGEQFRILDPPSLPDKPKSPNHLLWSFGGLTLGCFLGLSLLVVREFTDVRIRREDDLDGVVDSRILVRIPHLTTPFEGRWRTFSRWSELALDLAMAILIVAGNLYSFYKG